MPYVINYSYTRTNFIGFCDVFIVLILIGDRIFLRLEPQNYIACHQTLIYGSGYEIRYKYAVIVLNFLF